LLVFYPWAFTPVCGRELEELRDRADEVRAAGVTVFAVSCDPISSLRAYDDQFGLGLPLVSDFWPHGAIAAAYRVFDADQGCARRSSYLIDTDGVIRYAVHNPMGEARDIDAYLAAVATL
jgi:peroxiredoxin